MRIKRFGYDIEIWDKMEDNEEYQKYYLPNRLSSEIIYEMYNADKNIDFEPNVDYTVDFKVKQWDDSISEEESSDFKSVS